VDDVADTYLTLHEAAAELGVHYMTAYRYVRQGFLQASKVGGVWWVNRADLEDFRTQRAAGGHGATDSGESPEPRSGGRGRGRGGAPWTRRLENRLMEGDETGAWSLIEAAINAGTEVEDVYLSLLAPALVSIGERWHRGEIGIFVEHRATGIATRLISRLGARCLHRGRTRGVVVLGAPSGEEHSMPLMILADIVRCAGYEVCDLGSNTPVESFVQVASGLDSVVAVGVSVFTATRRDEAARTLAAVRRGIGDRAVLFAGGAAVKDVDDARTLGADEWAPDAREFVATLTRILDERDKRRKDRGA